MSNFVGYIYIYINDTMIQFSLTWSTCLSGLGMISIFATHFDHTTFGCRPPGGAMDLFAPPV